MGNVTAITDTINAGQVQTFGYDARDRLIWARTNGMGSGQYNEAYGYDRMGSMVTRTVGGGAVWYGYGVSQTVGVTQPMVPGPWRVYLPLALAPSAYPPVPGATASQPFAVISTTAGFRAAYDANGNMTLRVKVSGAQRITYTQEYNAENRLVGVSGGATASYVYDGDGNRVKATVSGVTTVYVGNYYEQEGSTVRQYYYANGQRVAMRVNGTLYWLLTDHLGSTNVTLDAGGNRVTELRYYPYGSARYNSGGQITTYRFTGQRWDGGTGLYWYNSRWYDPIIGRFV